MNSSRMDTETKIEQLRKAFDESFAAPEISVAEARERMLTIRVGEVHLAIRVSEIAGVEAMRKIVPLPTPLPGLLGIAGARRRVFAVYALGALLGAQQIGESPRWLVLIPGHDAIAFAIDELEGYIEVPVSRIHAIERSAGNEHMSAMMVEEGEVRRLMLHVPSVVAHALRIARVELPGTERD
jgi:chemotaxis signal transduction protein